MNSFINLLADDVWSEADIVNRTEAMIASEFPVNAVAILNRKVTASAIGQYSLSAADQAEVAHYAAVSNAAAASGNAARADMIKLQAALDYERAQARLAHAVVPGDTVDIAERAAAQAVISAASADTLALVALRNPVATP